VRVRLLVDITGTRDGLRWPPAGGVVDLPAAEAATMIGGGLAVEAADGTSQAVAPPVETAALVADENAATPAPRARKAPARKKAAPKPGA
jgi:hypothetical protein